MSPSGILPVTVRETVLPFGWAIVVVSVPLPLSIDAVLIAGRLVRSP